MRRGEQNRKKKSIETKSKENIADKKNAES
jgi:hypothetical protein